MHLLAVAATAHRGCYVCLGQAGTPAGRQPPIAPLTACPLQAPPQPFSSQDWEPRHPHMMMYQSLLDMVGKHEWSPEEQGTVLKFRARFGERCEWVVAVGRGVCTAAKWVLT